MPFSKLLLLGAIAGYTIFLGLPFARLRKVSEGLRIGAGAASTGVLLFLLVDVTKQMTGPIEDAAKNLGQSGVGDLALLGVVAVAGLVVSFLGLVYLPSLFPHQPKVTDSSDPAVTPLTQEPLRLAMLIAIGIGLHNFAEGLAIGQAAAGGSVSLAWLLILGFGLHNATEGFGITGPLVGQIRPSWKFLLLVGLIGGSPTFFGTIVGRAYTSNILSTLFLALAAGSIIYVVQTLIYTGLSSRKQGVFSIGLLVGLLAGIATDLIISAAGI